MEWDKRHLACFFEAVPVWMNRLGWKGLEAFGLSGSFGSRRLPGAPDHLPVLRLDCGGDSVRVAGTVCYDICFPGIHREYMRQREDPPDIFVCAMNEGFDRSGMVSRLSFKHARLRAIECRRPYYRVSRGGLCGIVDSWGRVRARVQASLSRDIVIVGRAPLDNRVTAYCLWGDWLPLACCAIVVTVAVAGFVNRARSRLRGGQRTGA